MKKKKIKECNLNTITDDPYINLYLAVILQAKKDMSSKCEKERLSAMRYLESVRDDWSD